MFIVLFYTGAHGNDETREDLRYRLENNPSNPNIFSLSILYLPFLSRIRNYEC